MHALRAYRDRDFARYRPSARLPAAVAVLAAARRTPSPWPPTVANMRTHALEPRPHFTWRPLRPKTSSHALTWRSLDAWLDHDSLAARAQ
eukprot:9443756-Prorocentrum_lima.AAC.2